MFRVLTICSLCAAAAAAPAIAGIEMKQFGKTASPRETTTAAATIVATASFTAYTLSPPKASQPRSPAPPAAAPAAFEQTAPALAASPPSLAGDPCLTMEAAEYGDIGSETRALRRYYHPFVRAAECRAGLPVGLLDSLILAESRYRVDAVSSAGAVGLTQLMPGTARDLGVRDRNDPVSSIHAGARYLRSLIDKFGSLRLGVAAYNAGPGSVARAGGIPLNGETPTYVARVLGRWQAQGLLAVDPSVQSVVPTALPGISQQLF